MPKAAKMTHPPRRPLNCENGPPLKPLLPPRDGTPTCVAVENAPRPQDHAYPAARRRRRPRLLVLWYYLFSPALCLLPLLSTVATPFGAAEWFR
eukprot:2154506-Prymnesium_polylepis.1